MNRLSSSCCFIQTGQRRGESNHERLSLEVAWVVLTGSLFRESCKRRYFLVNSDRCYSWRWSLRIKRLFSRWDTVGKRQNEFCAHGCRMDSVWACERCPQPATSPGVRICLREGWKATCSCIFRGDQVPKQRYNLSGPLAGQAPWVGSNSVRVSHFRACFY